MSDSLIHRAAELMQEQALAYQRLTNLCDHLTAALARGDPQTIETFTRNGEKELLSIRARLVQLTTTLSTFAAARASTANPPPLPPEVRSRFERASREMIQSARCFQQTHRRALALTMNGMTFAHACIERCGALPTTYQASYGSRGEHRSWA